MFTLLGQIVSVTVSRLLSLSLVAPVNWRAIIGAFLVGRWSRNRLHRLMWFDGSCGSFLVADAFVLVGAAVHDLTVAGVALEPGLSRFELASPLDGAVAMALAGVFCHMSHLVSEGQ